MSGTGGFAVSRRHSGDRFYNPPAMRRHHQQLLKQQQQQQRQLQRQLPKAASKEDATAAAAAENRSHSECCGTTLSEPVSDVTNLDRLIESVTPFVPAQFSSEVSGRGPKTGNVEIPPFYSLGDLWESFGEWSAYGVGVPLLLNGSDSIIQYYVPFLSGIQLYIDPLKSSYQLRKFKKNINEWKPGEKSDTESSKDMSCGASRDCEADRRAKCAMDGLRCQQSLANSNSLQLNRLSLRDKTLKSSSSDEAEISNSPRLLMFEYLEQEQPHNRKPLADKVSILSSQFPELRMCRSCDLLPESWISVAWYPIYRIPMGPTLRDLDASFLTFHLLSAHSRCNDQPQIHGTSGQNSKISLPVFGLASYKLKGSILTPGGPCESDQENSLLQAADNWLSHLQLMALMLSTGSVELDHKLPLGYNYAEERPKKHIDSRISCSFVAWWWQLKLKQLIFLYNLRFDDPVFAMDDNSDENINNLYS